MANSFIACYMHCVFSTKGRVRSINASFREPLWQYIGGIARENKMKALAVGGVDDHVHALVSIPSTLSVAQALQTLKGGSSLWVNKEHRQPFHFDWQEGYGAFSVSASACRTSFITFTTRPSITRHFPMRMSCASC
ncbi:MAG TPA: IS200/IS605 family transposase [Planctomycetota bacterium]|nr:IS200/IS605 family transposase [Planctomycetota bacterium]